MPAERFQRVELSQSRTSKTQCAKESPGNLDKEKTEYVSEGLG